MEKVQVWKDEKDSFQRTDGVTDEMFSDSRFQAVFYSLTIGETITISPEPYEYSIFVYLLDGNMLLHTKGYEEELHNNNSVLLSDIDKTYILEALSFTRIIIMTSTDLQVEDDAEDYLKILKKVEEKDRGTWGHGRRVGKIAMKIAQEYDESYDLIALGKAATLHDIGKINTPVEILLKPGKLTEEEFAVIKKHPLDTYEILKKSYAEDLAVSALQHHEKLDGSGYPYGLKGDEICLNARIIAIADVFDAMTSERSYHKPAEADFALRYLELHPEAFDIRFVKILRKLLEEGSLDYILSLFHDHPGD